jgi:Phosphatase
MGLTAYDAAMPVVSLSEARAALVAAGIAGPHQSHSRDNNIGKIKAMLDDDVEGRFGMSGITAYSAEEILGFLAALTGCSADITNLEGCDTIDPGRTVDAIVAAARRLAEEATRGSSLLCVTGHPTGLLEHHIRVVEAYRNSGGKVLHLREEEPLSLGKRRLVVRFVGGVGVLSDWGQLKHTHSSAPMEALLEGAPWPDIVLGDHGWAGAAIERTISTIAVMDINDPALAVAAAEGAAGAGDMDVIVIPMDDNRSPRLYEPSWRIFEAILAGEAITD